MMSWIIWSWNEHHDATGITCVWSISIMSDSGLVSVSVWSQSFGFPIKRNSKVQINCTSIKWFDSIGPFTLPHIRKKRNGLLNSIISKYAHFQLTTQHALPWDVSLVKPSRDQCLVRRFNPWYRPAIPNTCGGAVTVCRCVFLSVRFWFLFCCGKFSPN